LGTSARRHLVASDIETAQPFDQLPRNLAYSGMAPTPIGIGKCVKH
jgi:hypothetical protein